MSLTTGCGKDRLMVFIDLRNVLDSSLDAMGAEDGVTVDLCGLVNGLVGGRNLVAAYVYDARAPYGTEDPSKRLRDRLEYLGFRVVVRDSCDPNRGVQKEVDVCLSCDMVAHALMDHFDTAVVVSGDRDFIPAIEHIQSAGKRVEVAAFRSSVSSSMVRAGDMFHELDSMPVMMPSHRDTDMAFGHQTGGIA